MTTKNSQPLRPIPFWAWNGWLNQDEIESQLRYFAEVGFGGAFIHARPGLVTEFLSEEWFTLWRHAVEYGKNLGLECLFYDENTFPSGFSGGHVLANDPSASTSWIAIKPAEGVPENQRLAEWQQPDGRSWAMVAESGTNEPWYGGYSYANLLRKGAGEAFWQAHHARHIQACPSDLGRYCFTDEPWAKCPENAWAWSAVLEETLRPVLGSDLCGWNILQENSPLGDLRRIQYWIAHSQIFAQEFLLPYAQRCTEVGWLLTGHINEHRWPSPYGHGSVIYALRCMHTPGTDLLGFQFDRSGWKKNTVYWLNSRQAESASLQFHDGENMCESVGGMGYELAPGIVQALEGFALAAGVTLMVPHLTYYSMRGTRKHEWPGTFSAFSPWMKNYRTHSDHLAKAVGAILSGQPHRHILVLSPDIAIWKNAAPAKTPLGQDRLPRMTSQGDAFLETIVALHHAQWDFDLGDELLLAEYGSVEGQHLHLGKRKYDLIIVPREATETLSGVHHLLEKFAAAGGTLLLGENALQRGVEPYSINWISLSPIQNAHFFTNNQSLLSSLDTMDSRPFTISSQVGESPAWRHLVRPDGSSLLFISNPWTTQWQGSLQTPRFATIFQEVGACSLSTRSKENHYELMIPPAGWILLELHPTSHSKPLPLPPKRKKNIVPLQLTSIARMSPNIMPLDFPSLERNGEILSPEYWSKHDANKWRAEGWVDDNPWRGAIQYRRNVIDQPSQHNLPWSVHYNFDVALTEEQIALANSFLAIEVPERFEIRLNNQLLDFTNAPQWRIHDYRIVCAKGLRTGSNHLEIHASHDDAEMELPSVQLMGEWACVPASTGFRLEAVQALTTGADWSKQGIPFYDDWVRCSYLLEIKEPSTSLTVNLSELCASTVRIILNGKVIATPFAPEGLLTIAQALSTGTHELILELCGWSENLMGPHLKKGLAIPWVWEYQCEGHPNGEALMFHPFGCLPEITVEIES